jgi:small subunit ribosomal protein S3Ae
LFFLVHFYKEDKMAIGKNPRISKSKKGGKKKVIDPFTKKDWYDIRAPSIFATRTVGKTLVNRSQGTHIAADSLKGRVLEVNLADLTANEEANFKNFKLKIEEVQGKHCLTNFFGMNFTTDKLRSLVKKWQTLIEAFVDVKTQDGYHLRLFCLGFTKKISPVKKTCYAQGSQIKAIRKKMVEIMTREAASVELKDLVVKLIPDSIAKIIEKECQGIYPLRDVAIRKVKIIKSPKYDPYKLMELHDSGADTGSKV